MSFVSWGIFFQSVGHGFDFRTTTTNEFCLSKAVRARTLFFAISPDFRSNQNFISGQGRIKVKKRRLEIFPSDVVFHKYGIQHGKMMSSR